MKSKYTRPARRWEKKSLSVSDGIVRSFRVGLERKKPVQGNGR